MSVVANIQHYQKSIEKCQQDESRLLHCINKLYNLPVTVQHLQETGVGRTINSLRKSDGDVGEAARALVAKWKRMVEAESDDEPDAARNNDRGDDDDQHRQHHESSKRQRSDSRNEKPERRDKHRSEESTSASGSRDVDHGDGRKRRKEDEVYHHHTEKRRRVESEDEGIDEDADGGERGLDSDSEQLHIEEDEQRPSEELQMLSEDEDDIRHSMKQEQASSGEERNLSDDEYGGECSKFVIPSPVKETKSRYSEGHRSSEKSIKKERHSSEYSCKSENSDRNKNRSSSHSSEKSRNDSSESDGRKSSNSSSSKSKDKDVNGSKHSSSSSRSEHKIKDKHRSSENFDLKKVKSERNSDNFDVKKVKSEPQDKEKHGSDVKKVTPELEEYDKKSSSGSKSKEEKVSKSDSYSKKGSKEEKGVEKSKHRDKEKKEKHKDKHREKGDKKSSSHKEDKKRDKEKKNKVDLEENGVDSFSGTSFAEALGMCVPEKPKKKSSQASGSMSSSPSTSSKTPKSSQNTSDKRASIKDLLSSPNELERQCSSMPLDSLDMDEDLALPAINPHYRPLPQPNYFNSPPKKGMTEDEALSNLMYAKVQRTKVFSGNKTGYTSVPTLFDICTRVLQENIDALEYTGGVPFDLIKPVLERASPDQLFTLEDYNAYLIEDTDVLWEFHCKKEFRNKKREEMETWREMFMRCREEREKKLRDLTTNITLAAKAKSLPVRKTQLAYVEGTVKPPRNILRKQAKFGTANASSSSSSSFKSSSASTSPGSSSSGLSSSFTGRSAAAATAGPAVSVPPPRGAAGGNQSNSCKPKPKAPLMQKTLQLIKSTRYKR